MTSTTLSAPVARLWPQLRRPLRLLRVVGHIGYGLGLAVYYRAFDNPHRTVIRRVARRWLMQLLGILDVQVKVHGRVPEGAVFLVSNHVSWLDIPVIGACLPVHFLSKAEVRDWPLIGRLAVAAGTLFIRRGAGESGRKAQELASHLRAGRPVLVFPEGTTTTGEGVRTFFPQLFQAPLLAGVPVQPLAIRYRDAAGQPDAQLAFVGDDAFHTHLWALLLRDRIRVTLTFCDPLTPAPDADGRQVATEARSRIQAALLR